MKTRDRILVTSLELFNTEGEQNTTTIDIAHEMDISPGNLYYHFKGKDDIITELFNQFDVALDTTLRAPLEKPLGQEPGEMEDNWYYLHVLLEEMYHYRFLYQSLEDILARFPTLKKRFQRLLALKKKTLLSICSTLIEHAGQGFDPDQLDALVENLAQLMTFWFSWSRLAYGEREPQRVVHQGVLQLMTMIGPYLGESQEQFLQHCQEIYRRTLVS